MSNDRAVEVSETGASTQDASWVDAGEPLFAEHAGAPPKLRPPAPPSGPQPPRRRWQLLPRSLSGRLVTFVVALVVIMVTAAGAATYVALQSFLFDRLDQQLNGQSDPSHVATYFERPAIPDSPIVRGPQEVWAVALDTSGDVIKVPPRLLASTMTLSTGQRSRMVAWSSSPKTITTADGKHLRVVVRSIQALNLDTGDRVTARVVVGLSTDEVTRTLHRLVWIEVAIGGFAVTAAVVLTSWGVHLSLRPLNRVTRTAREVTAELSPDGAALDRRVPDGDPQTEVGQLAESFNSLMGTVETQFAARVESERRMRQFLADASHELRTPLTSIRGYAELARMRRAGGEPEQADTMQRIESEGTRMSRLVDDLLLLARGDQGAQPQREPVDVGRLIEEAVDGVRVAHPGRRIEVAAPPALHLAGDHDQLLRGLRNLVANAAVHTDPAGPIRVVAQAEDAEVVIRVIDSGPGLPPELAQHVFERFWRADKARTRARGGTGLGLAIVASIVGAHQGAVDFQSTVTGGTTVTVRLPRTVAPAPPPSFS
jgi:two-component system OmpR family sensor kinase